MKLRAVNEDRIQCLERGLRTHFERAFLMAGIIAGFLFMGWPAAQLPQIFPDSESYINWPDEYWIAVSQLNVGSDSEEKVFVIGQRPPVYPFFLYLSGTEENLVRIQFVISVLSWCCLGWCVARGPGLIAGGGFALFPTVWLWTEFVLTESLSLSLTALGLSATLLLLRRWTWPRFAFWVGTLIAFGFIRDINLYTLPFLAVPALRTTRWRSGLVIATAIGLFVLGTHEFKKHHRGHWPLLNPGFPI